MVNRNNGNNNGNRRNGGGKGGGKGNNGRVPGPQRRNPQTIVRARNPIPAGLPPAHHFNAFGPQKPQAMAFSIGPATHIGGLASKSTTTDTTNPIMWIYQPSGGINQLMKSTTSDSGLSFGWPPDSTSIVSTGITATPSTASPASILCSRGSVRLRNTSRAADAGGVVRVLRLGTPIEFSANEMGQVYSMVKSHPRTHTYTGSSLTATHQWDCIPVDQASYTRFISPVSGYDVLQHSSLANVQASPAVSSVIFVFENFSQVQDYEFSIAACYYARYRYTGPLASMASLPPTTTIARSNMLRDIAESVGSAGRKIITAGGNAMVNKLIAGTEGFVGNLFRQNVPLGRAAGRWSTISAIQDVSPLALTG